ncbi:hypothetical protein ILUMI_00381 [Ignelater luminosus]|uniref:DUF659 domain-containing protein n=1 Tax=Ignelater luminosus TaxID=2038154 RepID=A0A8K0DKB6_IGNLU|nr:hypothetical protein ILUMI_00381 [Ignelater luminosus]
MPKVAQSFSSKLRSWIAPYNIKEEVFTTVGKVVYCNVCFKHIGSDRKSQIDAHCTTEKYTGKKTPNESTLRKTYLPDAFNDIMKRIALELKGKYFYIVVDETTDNRGCYIANLLIGELNPNSSNKPFLVASQELEKTNHTTVARFINDNLKRLFGEYRFEDKLLLMTSDAAPYMVKAFKSLQIFYSNVIHVTCIVHGLNRIAEKVRELCPAVNILKYYECKTTANPVVTRWGTWLLAAIFYSDNFVKFKVVMQNLEEDAANVTKVKALLSETAIVKELAFIKSYIEFLPDIMEALETRGMTLKDQLEKLSFVEEKLKIVPGKEGKVFQQKFEYVFGNNSGLKQMKNFDIGNIPSDMDPFRLSCYTYAPLTSVEVERSFSIFKNILDDRRHSFVDKNLEF